MQFKPRFLIHCAAQRFPEKVDLDPEGAANINIDATRYLAKVAGMNTFLLLKYDTFPKDDFYAC